MFWTGHWFETIPVAEECAPIAYIAKWIQTFSIYGFTLVSGYLYMFKYSSYRTNGIMIFLTGKIKRLIIPSFFVSTVWIIPILYYFNSIDVKTAIKNYYLAISPSQLWFLWMLFFVFVIIWPVSNIMISNRYWGWFIAFISYLVAIVGRKFIPNYFNIWTAFSYVPFFYIGMCLRQKEDNNETIISEKIPYYIWIIVDILLFIIYTFIKKTGFGGEHFTNSVKLILNMWGAVMAWLTFQTLGHKVNWRSCKPFIRLSESSMPIYLFHQQIIYFVISTLNGRVNPIVNGLINFLVSLLGAFLISTLLMKWKITRFLIGEK